MFDIYNISILTEGNIITFMCYKIEWCAWKIHNTAPLRSNLHVKLKTHTKTAANMIIILYCTLSKLLIFCLGVMNRKHRLQTSMYHKSKEN